MDWFLLHPENKHEKLECPEDLFGQICKTLKLFQRCIVSTVIPSQYYSFISAMF